MIGFEEAVNAVYEGVRRDVLTRDFSAKLLADVKMIFDNMERVKTARDLVTVAKGINTYREYLRKFFARNQTSSVEFDFPGSVYSAIYIRSQELVAKSILDTLGAQFWADKKCNMLAVTAGRLMQLLDTVYSAWIGRKRGVPNRFELDAYRQEAELLARDLRDELDDLINELASMSNKPLTLRTPIKELTTIEGFPVTMQGYDEEDPDHRDMLELARAGIPEYVRAVKARLPKLLALTKRVNLLFDAPPGMLGVYYTLSSTINIGLSQVWEHARNTTQFVWTLAHETGHHLFQKVLTQAGRNLWEAAVDSDVEEIDLDKLSNSWPLSARSVGEAALEIGKTDPKTAIILQLLVSFGAKTTLGKTFRMPPDRYEFFDAVRLLRNEPELRTVRVPKHPVTAYGSTSAQETFSEVTGVIVSRGHRGVHPAVRDLYQTVTQWELP